MKIKWEQAKLNERVFRIMLERVLEKMILNLLEVSIPSLCW